MSARLTADTVLPQRDILLDSSAMTERLGRFADYAGNVRITRVNYKPRRSLRVVYEVNTAGTRTVFGARAYPMTRPRASADEPQLNSFLWAFPDDRRLQHLSSVWSPATDRLVAYAPEKTATLARLHHDGTIGAYVRVSSHHTACAQAEVHQRLHAELPADDSSLRVPSVREWCPSLATLHLEPIVGPSLEQHLTAVDKLGRGLARLHSLAPSRDGGVDRFDASRFAHAAETLALVRPDVAVLAHELAARLCGSRPPPPEEVVWLHGDVHLKNAILADDRIALIDFEDTTVGPAAVDLASLLAELHYRQRVGFLSPAAARSAMNSFLSGYASLRQVPPPRTLRWFTAAALFVDRALGAIHRLRGEGLAHLPALLSDADALLDT